MFEQSFSALLTLDLMTLWILKDRGIIDEPQIQSRLRQTREKLASHYGEGPATTLIDTAINFVAHGNPENVVPFPGPKGPVA